MIRKLFDYFNTLKDYLYPIYQEEYAKILYKYSIEQRETLWKIEKFIIIQRALRMTFIKGFIESNNGKFFINLLIKYHLILIIMLLFISFLVVFFYSSLDLIQIVIMLFLLLFNLYIAEKKYMQNNDLRYLNLFFIAFNAFIFCNFFYFLSDFIFIQSFK